MTLNPYNIQQDGECSIAHLYWFTMFHSIQDWILVATLFGYLVFTIHISACTMVDNEQKWRWIM